MAEKSVIIIGAGVAGLTAGCYAQMNGYTTQIFEMDSKPGGLCTSWERKGYTIDGCLHWLVGSSPDSDFYRLWQEVGALQGKQVINHEQCYRVESTDGKVLTLYTDVDRLEQHLKEIAPEDSEFIEELTNAIRHFTKLNLPVNKAPELYGPLDKLKMVFGMGSFMGDMRKWGKMTIKDVAMRFQNPFLREAFQRIMLPDFSSFFLLMTLAWLAQKNAGYVIGGSGGISRSMVRGPA